jgi:hypothetical protein
MNPKEFLAKQKVHAVFVGAFLFALAFSITINLTAGQTFVDAIWKTLSDLRPMDYFLFALCWYMGAVHRPKDDWDSSLITLNLSSPHNQK